MELLLTEIPAHEMYIRLVIVAMCILLGCVLGLYVTRLKEARQAIHVSNEKLAMTLASIGDGVITADTSGRVEFINKAASALTGWGLDEARGVPAEKVFNIINEFSRQPVENPVTQVLTEGRVVGLANHTLLISRDGSERVIADSGAPVLDIDGRLSGVVMVFRDDTERRNAEKRLKLSEERYRSILESMSGGVAVYEAVDDGADFVFKDFNGAAERIEKIDRERVIGKRVTEVFPGVVEFGILDIFRQVWKTGKPEFYPMGIYQDNRIQGWRENYIYKLPTGEVVAVYDDRTDEEVMRRALAETASTLQAVFDSSPLGIAALDIEGKVTGWNVAAERILGVSRDEAIGARAPFLSAGNGKLNELMLTQAIKGEAITGLDIHARGKDDVDVKLEISLSPLRGEGDRVDGVVAVFGDVTERRRIEKELKKYRESLEALVESRTAELESTHRKLIESERLALLGRFSGSIAHEIRNPLGVIATSAYYIGRKLNNDDPNLRKHVELIGRQTRQCAAIIESLLKMTRAETTNLSPLELGRCVSSGISSTEIPPDVRVEIEPAGAGPRVLGDIEQLRIVFRNLVRNAVDEMTSGGELRVSVDEIEREGKKFARVRFADTGRGIDKANIERIFEPFFTTKSHGFGFGLAMVRMIVERHGGEIRAGTSPGGGAEFTIDLPAAPD